MPWIELGVTLSAIIVVLTIIEVRILIKNRNRETNLDLIQKILNPSINNLNIYKESSEKLDFTNIYRYIPKYDIPSDKDRLQELRFWHPTIKRKIEEFNEFCESINEKIKQVLDDAKMNRILQNDFTGEEYEYSLEMNYEKNASKLNSKLEELGINKKIDDINKQLKKLPSKSKTLCEDLKKLRMKWKKRYHYKNMNF